MGSKNRKNKSPRDMDISLEQARESFSAASTVDGAWVLFGDDVTRTWAESAHHWRLRAEAAESCLRLYRETALEHNVRG